MQFDSRQHTLSRAWYAWCLTVAVTGAVALVVLLVAPDEMESVFPWPFFVFPGAYWFAPRFESHIPLNRARR
jgi:hypothetical protein